MFHVSINHFLQQPFIDRLARMIVKEEEINPGEKQLFFYHHNVLQGITFHTCSFD